TRAQAFDRLDSSGMAVTFRVTTASAARREAIPMSCPNVFRTAISNRWFLWSLLCISIVVPACQKPHASDDLRGKSMEEVAEIGGETQKLKCCSYSGAKDSAGSTAAKPISIWYCSDGQIAFGPDRCVIASTPGIRHCEVHFPTGITKADVRNALGSPVR